MNTLVRHTLLLSVVTLLILIACFSIPTIGHAQDSLDVPLLSTTFDFWGGPLGLHMEDDYAYLASGFSLRTLDVSDPEAFTTAGVLHDLQRFKVFSADGEYAYFLNRDTTLTVVQISDPTNPVEIATHTLPDQPEDMAVQGGVAYVVYPNLLRAFDVSEPAGIELLYEVEFEETVSKILLENGFIYAWEEESFQTGFYVLDTESQSVVYEGLLDDGSGFGVSVNQLTVHGSFLYVSASFDPFVCYDISDPSSPQYLGAIDPYLPITDLVANGEVVAYLNRDYYDDSTIGLIDVSDPTTPTHLDPILLPEVENWYQIWIEGHTLYAGSYEFGVHVFDISDPENPSVTAVWHNNGKIWHHHKQEDLVYLTGSGPNLSLEVLDVSDPEAPYSLGSLESGRAFSDVISYGDHLYTGEQGDLVVVDISDPSQPAETGRSEVGASVVPIAVNEDYIFLLSKLEEYSQERSILIYDISTPYQPEFLTTLSTIDVEDRTAGFFVEGNLAYHINWDYETQNILLEIWDISDPSNPNLMNQFICYQSAYTQHYATHFQDYIYIVNSHEGIVVVDVSDPTNPFVANTWEFEEDELQVSDLAADENLLVLHDWTSTSEKCHVMDISNPTEPEPLGYFTAPYGMRDLILDHGLLYASALHRFFIYDLSFLLSVGDEENRIAFPKSFTLSAAWPNPFNATTRFQVELPKTGRLRVEVFNELGQRVQVLAEGAFGAGAHEFRFDATGLSSGTYYLRAATGDGRVQARRTVLLK